METLEEKKTEAKEKAKAEAEEKAKVKAEEKAKAKVEEEVKTLGIKKTKVSMGAFKDKKAGAFEKEKKKQEINIAKRMVSRIARVKAEAKLKPIDKRRNLLKARGRSVKDQIRPNTYPEKELKAWIEELNMIENNPKTWNNLTQNGKIPFVPGSKKKKTAKDILDGMDLDE